MQFDIQCRFLQGQRIRSRIWRKWKRVLACLHPCHCHPESFGSYLYPPSPRPSGVQSHTLPVLTTRLWALSPSSRVPKSPSSCLKSKDVGLSATLVGTPSPTIAHTKSHRATNVDTRTHLRFVQLFSLRLNMRTPLITSRAKLCFKLQGQRWTQPRLSAGVNNHKKWT